MSQSVARGRLTRIEEGVDRLARRFAPGPYEKQPLPPHVEAAMQLLLRASIPDAPPPADEATIAEAEATWSAYALDPANRYAKRRRT